MPNTNFEGYDFQRPQNRKKSAKDDFAGYVKDAPAIDGTDKSALGAWFNQYIAPGLNADGYKVLNSSGDGFRFQGDQGLFDVDFFRGAGAPGGAFQWLATDPNAPVQTLGQQRPGVSTGMPVSGAPSIFAPQSEDLQILTPDDAVPIRQRYSLGQMLGGR